MNIFDDEVIEMIVANNYRRASRYIFYENYRIDIPYILSFLIHRSMYMERLQYLPVYIDDDLISLTREVSSYLTYPDEVVSYAMTSGDISILVYTIREGVFEYNTIHDLLVHRDGGNVILCMIDKYLYANE